MTLIKRNSKRDLLELLIGSDPRNPRKPVADLDFFEDLVKGDDKALITFGPSLRQ
jgi:hypothetical protein